MAISAWMDRTFYPDFEDNWDDDRFRLEIVSLLKPHFQCLDYGAGRGNVRQMNFRGLVDFVAGVDPDAAVFDNPYLDDARLLPLPSGEIPYDDESFDLVYCTNVMEHVEYPEATFKEVARVLKPGGIFMAKTPNKNHYMPLIARITPVSFHRFYNGLRGRKTHDTFETQYKCNSPGQVRKYQKQTGFELQEINLWEGRPEYLRIFWPLYVFGIVYERIVNATNLLAPFRSVMVFRVQKPAD
ncbi:MAG: class I SAM-dependent methyltransferase [Alphaproteobacteria bacterium]|nr:class I SAM-dependent methyltransferase [Alphaproteobacteria bacterium]